jgi:type II secretory pathway pseudopilin PulG
MLVVVSVLGVLAAVGLRGFGGFGAAGRDAKLGRDLVVLNAMVDAYRAGGGDVPEDATAAEVVEKLKTELADDDRERHVGFGGSYLDPRLKPVTRAAGEGPAGEKRAVWDSDRQRFAVTTDDVDGIARFELAETSGHSAPDRENRRDAVRFAAEDAWVWDYLDAGRSMRAGPDPMAGSGPGVSAGPPVPDPVLTLHPPLFSLDGGVYAEEDFDLELHFADPNPGGVSEVWYSVDEAPFERYTGDPVLIAGDSEVVAYARSLDPDSWVDSPAAVEAYREDILYFAGNTRARFIDPTGDDEMVVSVSNSDEAAEMWWGAPYTPDGWFEGNYLRFEGIDFADVRAFEEFDLGTLTYFNSTTYMGTNATGVDLELALQILVPDVTAAFTYGLSLLSTRNEDTQTADENADFVWVGDVEGAFSASIRGYDYTLELRFGEMSEDASGFTTIDTFHVHEGSWASGSVYGTLVRGGRTPGSSDTPTPIADIEGWTDPVP